MKLPPNEVDPWSINVSNVYSDKQQLSRATDSSCVSPIPYSGKTEMPTWDLRHAKQIIYHGPLPALLYNPQKRQ